MELFFPDYDNSILSVTSSVLRYYGLAHGHPSLPLLDKLLARPARNTVFIILDGLGSNLLDWHLAADSFLRTHRVADLSSVYPCTTAAATTSLQTGLTPLEHGWIGWNAWFREFGRVVDLFLDRDSMNGMTISPSPAMRLLPYEDIARKISRDGPPNLQIHKVMPPFDQDGVNSVEEMIQRIRACCSLPGEQLVLAYWHQPDTVMHDEGPASAAAAREIRNEDLLLGGLMAAMSDTRLILTADHGQVEIDREIYLDDVPELDRCLILPPSLESRMASLFVKADRRADFARLFNERFGDSFLLLSREEFFARGLLGSGTPHPKIDDFIGDFIACATGSAMLRYRGLFGRPHSPFHGHHAGLCRDEMVVPLIFAQND
jgi:hypothetical protein